MNSNPTLYFANSESNFVHKIDENIIIHIERHSNSVSKLYFSDEDNTRIPIPSNFMIITKDPATSMLMTMPAGPMMDMYTLYFTEKYEFNYEGNTVLLMKPVRGWNIIL
jgi:hypothetical protein